MPTRTRSDDLTTAGRRERRTSRSSSRRKAAIQRAATAAAARSNESLFVTELHLDFSLVSVGLFVYRSASHGAATAAAGGAKASSQRPLMYAYNDNGSMVDVRCEPAEWTVSWTLHYTRDTQTEKFVDGIMTVRE